MEIIDLSEKYEQLYFVCLEDWSEEMKEAGDHKKAWYQKIKDRGLRVKLALDERGEVGGMIQYLPVEHSFAAGNDLYFVNCIWVHGHKRGRGNFQKKGMGAALLQAAEDDVQAAGGKALVAWGLMLPFWMKASWFQKHGYRKVDRMGIQLLLWKRFSEDALSPRWIRPRKTPQAEPGKVTVTAFQNGWCPAQNLAIERAKRAAAQFGERVLFREIDTLDRNVFLDWGIPDGLWVDGKQVRTGPPPSYEALRKKMARRVEKLKT